MSDLLRLESFDNFFTTYKENLSEHFSILFGENVEDSEIIALDNLLIDVFGGRIVKKTLRDCYEKDGKETAVTRAVKECDLLCFESWKATKYFISEANNNSIIYPIKARNEIVTKREGETTDTTQNKENAFDNIQTASNTDSSESNGTHSETVTVTETKERSNEKSVFSNASEGIEFTKHNDYLKIIMSDIANNITLAIY